VQVMWKERRLPKVDLEERTDWEWLEGMSSYAKVQRRGRMHWKTKLTWYLCSISNFISLLSGRNRVTYRSQYSEPSSHP
jgi:hypothetical protein